MKVALTNGNQFAHNMISLASKLYWGKRTKSSNPCFWSKFWSMAKWPLRNLRQENAIKIWYLNENEQIIAFWHHFGLQQPHNNMFKLGWARAKSTQSRLNRSVDLFGGLSAKNGAESECWQNFKEIKLPVIEFYMILSAVQATLLTGKYYFTTLYIND